MDRYHLRERSRDFAEGYARQPRPSAVRRAEAVLYDGGGDSDAAYDAQFEDLGHRRSGLSRRSERRLSEDQT